MERVMMYVGVVLRMRVKQCQGLGKVRAHGDHSCDGACVQVRFMWTLSSHVHRMGHARVACLRMPLFSLPAPLSSVTCSTLHPGPH